MQADTPIWFDWYSSSWTILNRVHTELTDGTQGQFYSVKIPLLCATHSDTCVNSSEISIQTHQFHVLFHIQELSMLFSNSRIMVNINVLWTMLNIKVAGIHFPLCSRQCSQWNELGACFCIHVTTGAVISPENLLVMNVYIIPSNRLSQHLRDLKWCHADFLINLIESGTV